jgi:hypothetical protein
VREEEGKVANWAVQASSNQKGRFGAARRAEALTLKAREKAAKKRRTKGIITPKDSPPL